MEVSTVDMCTYFFDSLICHFEQTKVPPPLFKNDKYPLFVTWHKYSSNNSKEPSLRGCKGTFDAKEIHSGLQDFALISGLKDRRFSPITYNEISRLECSVSLLYAFEECKHVSDWEIGKHGIIIDFDESDGANRNATYLPEVAPEQGWNKTETLKSLIRKSGYEGPITEELLDKIRTTRYQSSQTKLHYKDYQQHKQEKKK